MNFPLSNFYEVLLFKTETNKKNGHLFWWFVLGIIFMRMTYANGITNVYQTKTFPIRLIARDKTHNIYGQTFLFGRQFYMFLKFLEWVIAWRFEAPEISFGKLLAIVKVPKHWKYSQHCWNVLILNYFWSIPS